MPRKVQQAQFRIGRVVSDWTTATAMIREEAALPGYVGPSVEAMEAVGQAIAALRPALADWVFATAAKEARGSARRQGRMVRAAIRGLGGPG